MQVKRASFYKLEEIVRDVENKVKQARERGELIDYLTFVPDGEPSLDINLGKAIDRLKQLGIKIAIISNASLIWNEAVQDDLRKANWVSLKIDAVSQDIWRKINRPNRSLRLDQILQGISEFAQTFNGELTTETMLIHNINDKTEELEKIVNFIVTVNPHKSYIAIPTRPPAEKWVYPATEHTLNIAYQLFSEKSSNVEFLTGYEGNAFAFTGNVEEDLLRITSVHPMREESVNVFLTKAKANWAIIEKLLDEDKLIEVRYNQKKFYLRKLAYLKRDKIVNQI